MRTTTSSGSARSSIRGSATAAPARGTARRLLRHRPRLRPHRLPRGPRRPARDAVGGVRVRCGGPAGRGHLDPAVRRLGHGSGRLRRRRRSHLGAPARGARPLPGPTRGPGGPAALYWADDPRRRLGARPDFLTDPQWLTASNRSPRPVSRGTCSQQLPDTHELLRSFPQTSIVLEAIGWPLDHSPDGFRRWAERLEEVSVPERHAQDAGPRAAARPLATGDRTVGPPGAHDLRAGPLHVRNPPPGGPTAVERREAPRDPARDPRRVPGP